MVFKKLVLAAAVFCVALIPATEAAAQLEWVRLTMSGAAGYTNFDGTYRTDDGIPIEARVGLSFFRYLGVEATFGKVRATSDFAPTHDFPVDHLGGDVVVNLLPTKILNPYLLAGWTELRMDNTPHRVDMNGWEFGGGIKAALYQEPGIRVDLRLDARTLRTKNDPPLLQPGDVTSQFFATAGVHFEFFGGDKDSDADGVPDFRDECPGTPFGATVDSKGCTMDSDGDGVPDGLDLCEATPKGAIVDVKGCPKDTDGDGVIDGIDQCEGTPAGAVVDARGCPVDSDGDGVPDGLDACANTPAGVKVDRYGCPKDSDGDGVFDGLDQCEGTPRGVKVDDHGCPIPVNEMEKSLVNTGVISLNNIYFDTGSAHIKPESHRVLHEVAAVLVRWPSLKIEIGGHADSVGPDDYNLTLSRNRAHAVLDFLMNNYDGLRFDQFFVKGYGETQPIDTNDTAEGRSHNRRVEFKVLNREALPKE